MGKRKILNRGEYAVGYRRPPKAAQFKPGISGNPKGRPKGSRPVGAVLQDIIQQKVSITESGRTRRIPALEVIIRRLANDAMRSDPRAIRLLLSLVDRYGEAPESKIQLAHMLAEDEAILAGYLQEHASRDTSPVSTSGDKDSNDGD